MISDLPRQYQYMSIRVVCSRSLDW